MHFSWIRHWFVCTEIQCLEYFMSLWCFLRHPWTPNQWSRPCLAVSSNLTRSWWTSRIATIQALVIRIYTHHTHNTQHAKCPANTLPSFVVSTWSRNQFLNPLTLCKQCVISCYYRLIVMNIILYSFHNLKTYLKKTQILLLRIHAVPSACYRTGVSVQGGLPDRDPHRTETPTRQRPPGQRPPDPQTETLWTETPRSCDLWCMLGQRPPPPRWAEWLTDRCKKITLPQLRLRAVTITYCDTLFTMEYIR